MRCSRCGQTIFGLACEACAALASREAILKRQPMHLDDVRRGRLNFFAARIVKTTTWHIMLFGDRAHAYCGQEILSPVKHNRRDIPYDRLAEYTMHKGEICAKCLDALEAMLDEAHSCRRRKS